MFDDKLFANRHREIGPRGHRTQRSAELLALEREPRRYAAPLRQFDRLHNNLLRSTLLGNPDDVVGRQQIRRNGDRLPVHLVMAVADELAGLSERTRKAELVNYVVEPPLEQNEQVLARDPRHPLGNFEVSGELLLEHPVNTLDLLLLAQTDGKFGKARARLSVYAGRIIAPLD